MTAQEHLQAAEAELEKARRCGLNWGRSQSHAQIARAHAAVAHAKLIEEMLAPKEPSWDLPPLRPEEIDRLGLNDEEG